MNQGHPANTWQSWLWRPQILKLSSFYCFITTIPAAISLLTRKKNRSILRCLPYHFLARFPCGRCKWPWTVELQVPRTGELPLTVFVFVCACVWFFLFLKVILFSWLLLAVLGLHRYVQAFPSCSEWGHSLVVRRLLIAVGSLVAEHWLCTASVAPWHVGSSWIRDRTCVSFLDPLPLSHQGKPPLTHCSLQLTVEFCPVS